MKKISGRVMLSGAKYLSPSLAQHRVSRCFAPLSMTRPEVGAKQMWQYVFLLLGRQRGKSLLAGSGFLLAACALVLLSATTQTTIVQANQIISQNWRSSYDLVVLPSNAHIPSKNLIPGDMMEGYDGAISMQQYQQIQRLPAVQVVAPIAYIGYVQMPVPQLEFFAQPLPDGYYRLDLGLTAFNGQRNIKERGTTIIYYHLTSCDKPISNSLAQTLYQHGITFSCGTDPTLFISSPVDTGTFLLAAIDPEAENQLVQLDRSITSGRMLTTQDDIHLDSNPKVGNVDICPPGQESSSGSCLVPNYDIPVLLHMQLPGQMTMQGTFTRLSPGTLDPQQVLANGGAAYLEQLPHQQVLFNGTIPLAQSDPERFSGKLLNWNGHSWQPSLPFFGIDPYTASLKFLYTPSSLSYTPTNAPDGQASAYSLVPDGVQGPEAAFRALNSLHIAERSSQKNASTLLAKHGL